MSLVSICSGLHKLESAIIDLDFKISARLPWYRNIKINVPSDEFEDTVTNMCNGSDYFIQINEGPKGRYARAISHKTRQVITNM